MLVDDLLLQVTAYCSTEVATRLVCLLGRSCYDVPWLTLKVLGTTTMCDVLREVVVHTPEHAVHAIPLVPSLFAVALRDNLNVVRQVIERTPLYFRLAAEYACRQDSVCVLHTALEGISAPLDLVDLSLMACCSVYNATKCLSYLRNRSVA